MPVRRRCSRTAARRFLKARSGSDVEHGTGDVFWLLLCGLVDAALAVAVASGSALGGTGVVAVLSGTP